MRFSTSVTATAGLTLFGSLFGAAAASGFAFFERTHSSVPAGWKSTGAADKNVVMDFNIYLPQQNRAALDKAFWSASDPSSPDYQSFKSISEILSIVAPSEEQVKPVKDWLFAPGGLKEEQVQSYGDALRVRATVEQLSALFQTRFETFKHSETGRLNTVHVGPAHIPLKVKPFVELIYGLSAFPVGKRGRLGHKSPVKPNAGEYLVVAQSWQSLYGVPASFTPAGNSSQNVVQFDGETYSKEGVQGYTAAISPLTLPTPATTVGDETDAAATEAQLDLESESANGQHIQQWFWLESGTKWMLSFATEFFNTPTVPYVNSISYDWSELDQCGSATSNYDCNTFGVDSQGLVERTNTEFQKIGLRGVSILTASGDSGVFGRTDEGCQGPIFRPDFPAASPFVTSVGGTYIPNPTYLPSGGNTPSVCRNYGCVGGGTEAAVDWNTCHYASGGGFSNFAPQPAYQSAAVKGYLTSSVVLPPASYYNASNRAFPDVSAQGYNVAIYNTNGGQPEPVSGTSCASPTFAGIASLLVDQSLAKTGKPLGFLNPLLYQMPAAAFNDITIGNNKCTESTCAGCQGFLAYKGWDPVTGLGTPNYKSMSAALDTFLEKNKK